MRILSKLPSLLLLLVALLVAQTYGFVVPTPNVAGMKQSFRSDERRIDALAPHHRRSSSLDQHDKVTSLVLAASVNSNDNESTTPSINIDPYFAATWITLVAWAFTIAPGSVGSEQDTAMLQAIIDNPTAPGINELYYAVFNLFAVIPIILASIAVPQGRRQGLPAAPFLALTAAIGFFAAGPYLALRAPPRTTLQGETVSEFTRNVLDNRLFHWGVVVFTLYLPVAAQVIPPLQTDPTALVHGFVDLVTTSRFAAVSLADLIILHLSTVVLTPRDYLLRKPEASPEEARNVALASAILPVLGSAVYCALRPPLPESSED